MSISDDNTTVLFCLEPKCNKFVEIIKNDPMKTLGKQISAMLDEGWDISGDRCPEHNCAHKKGNKDG